MLGKGKSIQISVWTVGASLLLMTGCAFQSTSGSQVNESTQPSSRVSRPQVEISNVHVTKNDGRSLILSFLMDNRADIALPLQPSDFALTSKTTTLSPLSDSFIPGQVPAHSKAKVVLHFQTAGHLSGTIKPTLDFQPSSKEPEKFVSIGSVTIPSARHVTGHTTTSSSLHGTQLATTATRNNTAINSSSATTTNSTSNSSSAHSSGSTNQSDQSAKSKSTPSPTVRNSTADIAKDVELVKAKAGKGMMVPNHPNAQVSDGSGHMLYAFNIASEGDGSIQ